jgi:hypothetical protein
MMMDLKELFYMIDSRIPPSSSTSSCRLAKELSVNAKLIEQTVRGIVGTSFREYLESKKLAHALKALEEERKRTVEKAYGKERAEQRISIPGATVAYLLRGRGIRNPCRSGPFPLYDLSSRGMAFLCDHPLKPGRELLAIIECTKLPITLLLNCRVVYAVAENLVDFRYRLGVQFKPFESKRGSNHPESLEFLAQLMRAATSFDVPRCEDGLT